MPVTITRNPGQGNTLFFQSGQISFSQLRSYFKESGGPVSASELRRDTDVNKENPIVPDATHNEQISTGSNLSLSQFRGSVKRYLATQSGTDDNSHGRNEPGFRMGLYDPYGNGLDFAGGGVNGRDGQGGNSTGNHIKNVQKGVLITGTCGSVQFGIPAAQLAPRLTVNNFRIDVSGSILGYGGDGGYNPQGYPVGNASGEDGGIALNLGSIGKNNRVIVGSGARIYGGGGGGEQGQNGARGSTGTCQLRYDREACNNCSCDRPNSRLLGCSSPYGECGNETCEGPWWRRRCSKESKYRAYCIQEQTSTTPIQGIGGRGGNGRGYGKARTNGQNGSAGTCPTCPGGWSLSGGECGTNGGRGGDGGEWGQDGGETTGNRTRGRGGAAINKDGSNTYALYGTTNSNTIKGAINL